MHLYHLGLSEATMLLLTRLEDAVKTRVRRRGYIMVVIDFAK